MSYGGSISSVRPHPESVNQFRDNQPRMSDFRPLSISTQQSISGIRSYPQPVIQISRVSKHLRHPSIKHPSHYSAKHLRHHSTKHLRHHSAKHFRHLKIIISQTSNIVWVDPHFRMTFETGFMNISTPASIALPFSMPLSIAPPSGISPSILPPPSASPSSVSSTQFQNPGGSDNVTADNQAGDSQSDRDEGR